MQQLSGLDALFLHGETRHTPMNLSGVGIYDPSTRPDGRIDFDTIVDYAAERTRRSPLFRRRVVRPPFDFDHPYWDEDENFEARSHVHRTSLPAPGGRAELDAEVARIHALPLDRDGPLWEWWYIDGLETVDGVPSGAFALLFKLHHAAFDGIAAWEVINVSHDTEPGHQDETLSLDELGTAGAPGPRAPSWPEMAVRAYRRTLSIPFDLARIGWQSRPLLARILRSDPRDSPLYAGRAPKTRFNGPVRDGRVHRKTPITLGELKRIRALAEGATINDAVLAIIAGALRRYLDAEGELPKRSLRVGMPISIRAPGDASAAGNQVLLAVLPLATDIADPAARLAAIHERTRTKKEYVRDVPAHLLNRLMEFVPGPVVDAGVRAFVGTGAARFVPQAWNLIVTNVPASRVPIYLAGAQMLEYDACGPLWDGARLLHVITSYREVVNISFDASTEQLPDPDRYQQMIRDSMKEMIGAAPD